MVQMTGGEIIIDCLKQEGVKLVFGIPGDQLYPKKDILLPYGSPNFDRVNQSQ